MVVGVEVVKNNAFDVVGLFEFAGDIFSIFVEKFNAEEAINAVVRNNKDAGSTGEGVDVGDRETRVSVNEDIVVVLF